MTADAAHTDALPRPDAVEEVLAGARERYEAGVDFTMGIEEEYGILDVETHDLVPRYDDIAAHAEAAGLGTAIAGELLASEVEFRTGRCERWSDAEDELLGIRDGATALLARLEMAGSTSGTHPWADYREQPKVRLPYYDALVEKLQYVAHRNNTFGLHVHVGVRGADRAIAVADALREMQPLLLALSTSSPFLDGLDSGLCSTRAMTFSRNFPRGNLAPLHGDWSSFESYVRWLRDVGSIESFGQMWWGIRPHAMYGTVELRCFDGQPDVRDTLALAALAQGLVADLCARYDAGELQPSNRGRPNGTFPSIERIDENVWRAIRWGTSATFVDLAAPAGRAAQVSAADALHALVDRARAAGTAAGLEIDAPLDRVAELVDSGSSAVWQRGISDDVTATTGDQQEGMRAAFAAVVTATMQSARAATESD